MHRLPNGLVINVPASGMETRVIAFMEGTQPVGALSSFDFDRLTFAPGSPHLSTESQDQINTVASIMRAYPKVSVKVEGFSDNAGSPVTNLKLSQERANSVKQALVGAGIKSSRIKAVGGGPRNQRVVLDITSK